MYITLNYLLRIILIVRVVQLLIRYYDLYTKCDFFIIASFLSIYLLSYLRLIYSCVVTRTIKKNSIIHLTSFFRGRHSMNRSMTSVFGCLWTCLMKKFFNHSDIKICTYIYILRISPVSCLCLILKSFFINGVSNILKIHWFIFWKPFSEWRTIQI